MAAAFGFDYSEDDFAQNDVPTAKRLKSEENIGEESTASDGKKEWPPYVPKEKKYEYLDHTADVKLHSWGADLKEAFEQVAIAMFGYMTDLETVDVDEDLTLEISAQGHDMDTLLFAYMDEMLGMFCLEDLIVKDVTILSFDRENFKITALGRGEKFDLKKHPQGTEVKAITYSAMEIVEKDGKAEIGMIIDI